MTEFVRFKNINGDIGAGRLEKDGSISIITEPFWEKVELTGESVTLSDVQLLPPCQPSNIICVGLNYRSHLGGRPIPDPPLFFFKPLSSIAGQGDQIVLPNDAGRVDPEGEIVVVIGSFLQRPTLAQAEAGIFGFTAGNDVSAREWQNGDGQWWRAKGSDTFGVFGPSIVTGLKFDRLEVKTFVNDTEVQHGASSELIVSIPEIVHRVASVVTLRAGDVIFTGTPGSTSPLNTGDIVEVEVTGLTSRLSNSVT